MESYSTVKKNGVVKFYDENWIEIPEPQDYQNLQNENAYNFLRQQRNQLLTQTDWRMTTDYPYSDQTAWATYRTELRDLPATASPTLDENGQLTNVVWPTAPDDL